jgi:hypothetical protein
MEKKVFFFCCCCRSDGEKRKPRAGKGFALLNTRKISKSSEKSSKLNFSLIVLV